MSFSPRIQKQEGVSWPEEGCPLQKVILLMSDVTQNVRQGGWIPNPGFFYPLLLEDCEDVWT